MLISWIISMTSLPLSYAWTKGWAKVRYNQTTAFGLIRPWVNNDQSRAHGTYITIRSIGHWLYSDV